MRLSKEKRSKIALAGVCTAIVLALIGFFLVQPQRQHALASASKLKDLQKKIAEASRLLKQSERVKADLASVQDQLATVEKGMASGDRYSWLILMVNQFRTPYRVEISEYSREQDVEVGLLPKFPYPAVQFTLRGAAFYHDIGRFVADFENAFPYVRLQNLELEPNTSLTGADAEKLSFKVELVALSNQPAGK